MGIIEKYGHILENRNYQIMRCAVCNLVEKLNPI